MEQKRAQLTEGIDALADGLKSAEETFKQDVQSALQDMVAAMSDIAHLDEGRVQRITEQEAAALNQQLLENRYCANTVTSYTLTATGQMPQPQLLWTLNGPWQPGTYGLFTCCICDCCCGRRAASDVLQQLHANEVLKEQARYKRWQAACAAWCTLRSKHAVQCFCQHVRQDLAEPPERMALFSQLRDSQQEAHDHLLRLCGQLHQLAPPHLTAQTVNSWVDEAKQWSINWQQRLDKHLEGLQAHEQSVEAQVGGSKGVCRCHLHLVGSGRFSDLRLKGGGCAVI